jgi:hypothetical protein
MVADRQRQLVDLTGAIGRIQHPDILADLPGVGVGRREMVSVYSGSPGLASMRSRQ